MSPEQTRTPRDMLTPQTDIFAAGAVFYELLTGARAFQSDTAQGAMEKVRTFEPPPVHEINRDVPLRLSQIVEKMLAKDMTQRYTSFRDVLADLEELNESGLAFSTRKFEAGEVIFAEGDAGEYAFSVVSGTVEISKQSDGDKKVLAILGPGEIIGELAVFTDHPRTATATALDATEIRVMGAGEVKKELEKLRPWVGTMIRALSERFIGLNEKLVRLGRDD